MAQQANVNECLLRSIGYYSFVTVVDVDEFIIPRQHTNLVDLISSLNYHDAYIFKVRSWRTEIFTA